MHSLVIASTTGLYKMIKYYLRRPSNETSKNIVKLQDR